jgi:hypothetical protein
MTISKTLCDLNEAYMQQMAQNADHWQQIQAEYAEQTRLELMVEVDFLKTEQLALPLQTGAIVANLLKENCLRISTDYKKCSSPQKETYFSAFLSQVFSLCTQPFQPKVLDLYHDYAAIDDEFLNWWIAVKLEYKDKKFDFRIAYFNAWFEDDAKDAAHQFEIANFVAKLNEIAALKYGKYIYLDCDGEDYICFACW